LSTPKNDTKDNLNLEEEKVPPSKTIYFAAALFASRECVFNIELSNSLEEKGFKVNLP